MNKNSDDASKSMNIWACPCCNLDTGSPHKSCPSCGASLLLLAKIRIEAKKLAEAGDKTSAKTLYKSPKS